MTFYLNPYGRRFRMQALANAMSELDRDFEPQVSFPMDVKATPDGFELKAYLPGVSAEDLDIQIVNEVVTISGEVKLERDARAEYLLAELPAGRFHRVVSLPAPLDSEKVEASLESGILTLNIPKVEEAKPKSIKVTQK
ncbi:MAG: Hsp20/alpha crystallin family protein [Anaerolineales bacterium]|mgnify:FL=1|nr:Hsp20/alpha crystallin family protein [Anaerolineales bacterium]